MQCGGYQHLDKGWIGRTEKACHNGVTGFYMAKKIVLRELHNFAEVSDVAHCRFFDPVV